MSPTTKYNDGNDCRIFWYLDCNRRFRFSTSVPRQFFKTKFANFLYEMLWANIGHIRTVFYEINCFNSICMYTFSFTLKKNDSFTSVLNLKYRLKTWKHEGLYGKWGTNFYVLTFRIRNPYDRKPQELGKIIKINTHFRNRSLMLLYKTTGSCFLYKVILLHYIYVIIYYIIEIVVIVIHVNDNIVLFTCLH